MTSIGEIAHLDAIGQAELVRQGEVEAAELVEATIDRIERVNPVLNAVVTEMYDAARRLASGPLPDGPFAGVPFLLKDFLAEYKGVRFTEGSAFLRDYVPNEDSELVRRYRRSGLIVVAKTNAPELAIGATTEPRLFGPTHNPWDTDRTPGGSSGGAAAAVAAGVVPMAHGNDAGGSIRIPASCCGTFGLKPSRGRNPLGPHYGDMISGLVAEHALTRSVRDSAALLDATAGPAPGDPYWATPPLRPFLQEVGADPGRLRIAFTDTVPSGGDLHPDCVAAVRNAAELCAELGHEVVEATPVYDGEQVWQTFTTMISAGVAWAIDDWGRRTDRTPTEEFFEPLVWALAGRGRQLSAADYLLLVQDMQSIARQVVGFFSDYDVWLTSTLGEPPVPLGTLVYSGGDPFELRRRQAAFSPFTFITNITGQPAMSVPLHWSAQGLPVGTHYVSRPGDEATLFRLAAQLEAARPWSERRPPISA